MSGNNVTITEQGHLVVGNVGIPAAVVPAIEAHYRAKFAAERMPEDVQKLVGEARARTGEWTDIANSATDIRPIAGLAAALEAAYSQKGAEPEWEYRTLINGGDPFIHRSLTVGSISVAEWFSHDDPRTASGVLTLERRRVAGPWEPVEKGAGDEPR